MIVGQIVRADPAAANYLHGLVLDRLLLCSFSRGERLDAEEIGERVGALNALRGLPVHAPLVAEIQSGTPP